MGTTNSLVLSKGRQKRKQVLRILKNKINVMYRLDLHLVQLLAQNI